MKQLINKAAQFEKKKSETLFAVDVYFGYCNRLTGLVIITNILVRHTANLFVSEIFVSSAESCRFRINLNAFRYLILKSKWLHIKLVLHVYCHCLTRVL